MAADLLCLYPYIFFQHSTLWDRPINNWAKVVSRPIIASPIQVSSIAQLAGRGTREPGNWWVGSGQCGQCSGQQPAGPRAGAAGADATRSARSVFSPKIGLLTLPSSPAAAGSRSPGSLIARFPDFRISRIPTRSRICSIFCPWFPGLCVFQS